MSLDYDSPLTYAAQKMKFSVKDFFSKCEPMRKKLRICLLLLKKSLTKNFIFLFSINPSASNFIKFCNTNFGDALL